MAQITVDVGVKLNVMQSSLADLQKVLSHLEPDSAGFKSLSKIIAEMTREMEKFQVQTSKGFTSGKQFDQAERSIEKMEETLTKAQIAMSNLKFSDIKLDANQTKAFESLEQAITVAEQRLESIKEKTKQGIIADSASVNTLARLNPNAIQKSFDEIDAIVSNGVKKVEGDLTNAKAKFDELNRAVAEQTAASGKANNLFKNGITQQDWGELLNKTGTGFKPGGKQEFLRILKEQFEVSDADIAQLQKLSFGKINEAFKGNKFPDIFKNLNESLTKNNTGLTEAKNKVKEYEELQKAVEALYQKMSAAKADGTPLGQGMSNYNAEIERISQALAKLRGEAIQGVSANSTFAGSISAMQGQLQGFANQLDQASAAFLRLQAQQQTFNSIKMAITNFMGFNQILNLTKTAVRDAMNHIKELDTVMNGISIVTNMSTADLWKQVDAYSAMAQNFGISIKGAYEVSRIYYQQGLETNDVLNLTNETLKLCKVSGLDYANATDYMTTAIRGFKMEMSEAANVVDVYSNLAANTAVSQEELAVAMSKTASSMESVGSTFEETSAMIATMVAVTRESATNIGSAMKSIASRYGELTKDPTKLVDSEGEAMAFNKVDEALQSVGISMKTVDGQFREFTDVILELSDVWDQLSSVQQRYIATQFAGNRQQSRFLALVGNGDLLRENIEIAENSEDVGTLQALKALDSIESKLSQVQVAYQQFYTTIGAENIWKGALDGIRNFVDGLNSLPKAFDKIPIGAAGVIIDTISLIKTVALNGLAAIATQFKSNLNSHLAGLNLQEQGQQKGQEFTQGFQQGIQQNINISSSFSQIFSQIETEVERAKALLSSGLTLENHITAPDFELQVQQQIDKLEQLGYISSETATHLRELASNSSEEAATAITRLGEAAQNSANNLRQIAAAKIGGNLANFGMALNVLANAMDKTSTGGRILSGVLMGLAGGLRAVGSVIQWVSTGMKTAFPWLAVVTGAVAIVNGLATAIGTDQEKLERLNKEAENLSNIAKQTKADEKVLTSGIEKVKELEKIRYESAESAEKYQSAVDDLANSFPQLIVGFDEAGNVIIDTANAENALATARQKTLQATYDAAVAEQKAKQQEINTAKNDVKDLNNHFMGSSETFGSNEGQGEYIAGLLGQLGIYGDNNSLARGLYDQSISTNEILSSDNLQSILSTLSEITGAVFDKTVDNLEDLRNVLVNSSIYDNKAEQIENLLTGLSEIASTGLKNDNDILTDFAAELDNIDLTSEEGQQRYSEFIAAYNRLDEETQKDFNSRILNVEKLIDAYSTINEGTAQLQGMDRGVISSWLQLTKAQEDGWKFITDSSQAALLLTKQLYDVWGGEGSWDDFKTSDLAKDTLDNFKNGYDQLEEAQQKLLDDIGNDTSSYTAKDVIQILENAGKEIDNSMKSAIEGYYSNGIKEAERVQKAIESYRNEKTKEIPESLNNLQETINTIDEDTDFSSDAVDFITTQAKSINELVEAGFTNAADTLSQQTSAILDELYKEDVKADDRVAILDILKEANLNTTEGVESAIATIEASGVDQSLIKALVAQLEERKSSIVENVALSIQAELDDLLTKAEEDTKILSKATSGMSMKEANEFVNKAKEWGVDLNIGTDIISNGDKLILSEQAFNEVQRAYSDSLKVAANKAQENLNKAKEAGFLDADGNLLDLSGLGTLSELQRQFLKENGIKENETGQFIDDNGEIIEEETGRLNEAGQKIVQQLFDNINDGLEDYGLAVEQIQAMLFQKENWNRGDYSSLKEVSNGQKFNIDTRQYENIFDVNAFNRYLSGENKYDAINQPELKAAVEQARSGVDGFLSDLLSKGIDNFNITDYANTGIESSTFDEMSAAIEDWQGSYEDFVRSYVDLTGKSASEIDAYLAEAHAKDVEKNTNLYEAFNEITDSFNNFSYEAGQKLVRAVNALGGKLSMDDFNMDPITGQLSISATNLSFILANYASKMTKEQYNTLRAQLDAAKSKENKTNKFNEIIANRDKLSEENIAYLATLLNKTYITVRNMLTQNADGSYKMNLSTIQNLVEQGKIKVNEEFKELLANEIDSIISSLTGLGQLQGKGTTSIEDMQKRVGDINQQLGTDFKMQDLFTYNENLNAFTYSTQGLQLQAASLAKELDSLKQNTEANADQIWAVEQSMRNIAIEMANNIDVSGFLGMAIGDPARELKIDELRQALNDYNTVLAELGETEGLATETLISALQLGGNQAVQAAEAIAAAQGTTLSASDVEAAYRSQIDDYINAIDTITSQPGAIVDAMTAEIIKISGGKVTELGNTGQFVVQSAANLYEAYNNLLAGMKMTGEATLADLNKVAALALENRDGEQVVIDALGDAAGMTFSRFGEILADAGIELSKNMINQLEASGIVDLMGGNKMRIADFSRFADLMGWDANSEQYISAFKTYNDSLISMNRQAENNILEEVSALGDAKGGDWLNLTQLSAKLEEAVKYGSYTQLDALTTRLHTLGAELEDGILKLDSDANIPGILATIASYAQQYGGLLQQDMAELADVLDDVLSSYADAISKGINGKLTNAEALDLQNMTNGLGIDMNLDFTQTAEGLKLSQQAAIGLYQELQKIDSIKAQLVFDDVYKSLTQVGGGMENISQTTAKVEQIQRQLAQNYAEIRNESVKVLGPDTERVDALQAQNAELEAQLSLYQQIQTRQADDPNSYKFMDQSLPNYMQGAENYWNSVGKAFESMNEAGKSGYMSIQDFRNIVNEMNNMAAMSGTELEFMGQKLNGSAESASQLIQEGMSHLENIDGKGVKINMNKFGIDISSGAEGMQKGFNEGIKTMAQSQIDMLDAAIQMLEVVVAMEKLGDIDVDENGIFSIGDLFQLDENGNFEKNEEGLTKYTEAYQQYAKDILELAKTNPDLEKGLKNISINGITIKELFEDATDGIKNLNISEQDYFAVMDAFVQAAKNGDYDLEHLQESVWEILDKTLPDGTVIDTGNRSIVISGGTHYFIDWQDENTQEALNLFKGEEEKKKQQLKDAFVHYQQGEGSEIEVKSVLVAKGLIEVDSETGDVTVDGKTYPADSAGAKQAIAEASLKNAKVENIKTEIERDPMGGEVTSITTSGTIQVGNKVVVAFADESGNVRYHSDKLNQDYGSVDELQQAEYGNYVEQVVMANGPQAQVMSFEDWLYMNYHINLKTESTLTDEKGNAVDPNGSQIRQEMKDKLAESLKNGVKEGDATPIEGMEGHFLIKLPSGNQLEFVQGEGESLQDAYNRALKEQLGVDQSLIDNIASGIQTAFTGEGGTAISEALAKGIRTALAGNKEVPLPEGTPAPEVSLPEVSIKPKKISFNTSEMPEVTSEGGETVNVDIPDVTVKPSKVHLDTAEMPTPESTDTTEPPKVPIAEVIVKPTSAKLDTTGMGEPQADTSANAIIPSVPVAEAVIKPSVGKLDTTSMAEIVPDEGEKITAQVSNLTIQPTGTPQISSGVEGTNPVIPAMTADVTNLTVNSTGQPTVKTGEGTNPTITAMTADVTALTLDAAAPTFSATTLTAATSAGTDLATNVSTGLTNGASVVTTAASSLINTISVALGAAVAATDFKSVGSNIVAGIAQGMSSDVVAITTAANELATKIKSAVETKLGIASPSTVMATTGGYVAQGLAEGMNNDTTATSAATTLAEQVASAIQEKLDSINVDSVTASISTVEVSSVDSATYDKTLKLDDIEKGTATVKNLTVNATNTTAGGGLSALQNMDFSNASASLGTLSGYAGDISGASFSNFKVLVTDLGQAAQKAAEVWDSVKQFASQTFTVNLDVQGGEKPTTDVEVNEHVSKTEDIVKNETHTINQNFNEKIDVDTSGAQQSTSQLGGAAESMGSQASASAGQLKTAQTALNQIGSAAILAKAQINNLKSAINQAGGAAISAKSNIGNLKTAMTGFPNPSKNVSDLKTAMSGISSNASGYVSNLAKAMNSIPTGNKSASVTFKYSVQKSNAAGNMGGGSFAKGTSRALVTGTRKTLMGELGPELVVSNGRYFIAGQNGAEFVDLAKDAIVFNHKQTRRLFEQGMIGSRGRPITNETNAISLAKGRVPKIGGAAAGETPGGTTETISSVSVSPSQSDPIKFFSMAKGSIPSIGPALASAAAALAALKELRAMWQSLLNAGAKELGSMAGRDGGGGKGGKSCFVAGTLVRVLDGYKNIEDIQKGDLVLSYNTDKKINEYSEVVATMIHNTTEAIYSLYIEDDIIEATGIHPFFVKRDKKVDWIEAENLLIGDYVLFADGTWHRVDDIEVKILSTTVYNFEVSGNHNYYVGKNSILVHNKKGGGKKPSAGKNKKSPKGKGGKGGGGGGGDSEGEEEEIFTPIEYGTVTEEIQRWYDLLRQIDKLEQDISYQQALRKKYESDRVANGEKIYSTYQNELKMIKQEIADQKELATLQKSWYDAKRKELANTSYAKIFTYNDEGLQQYTGSGKPGSKKGLDILEHLNKRNAKGKFKLNVEQQLSYLKSVGFDLKELLYNDDGTVLKNAYAMNLDQIKTMINKRDGTKESEITNKEAAKERSDIMTQMMENFWSRIDGWRDELDSLYDSYNETATQIQENLAKQNEILQKLVDNEVKVEEDLYKAIESREQTLIDNLKKEQELLKNSTDKFIEGLNKQLSKEKEQYSNQKDQDELTKLQRQLAILQRSGGSATQIRSLQEQIDSKMQEDYFKKQEDSINTIKEAADEQIKRLEKQIDIQSEILEYQKSHGLLWEEVRYIMENWAEEDIASSILKWDKEFKEKSDLQIQEELKDIRERIQIYTEGRDVDKERDKNFDKYASNLEKDETANKLLGEITGEEGKKEAKAQAESSARKAYKAALTAGSTETEAQKQAQTAYNQSLNEYKTGELNQSKTNILNKENEGKSEEEQKDMSSAEEHLNYWKQNQATKAKVTGSSFFNDIPSEDKSTLENTYFSTYEELMNKDEYKNEDGTLNTEKIAQDALDKAIGAIQDDRESDLKKKYKFSKNFKAYKDVTKAELKKPKTISAGLYGLARNTKGEIITKTYNNKTYYKLSNDYWVPESTLPAAMRNDMKKIPSDLSGNNNVSGTNEDGKLTGSKTKQYNKFSSNPVTTDGKPITLTLAAKTVLPKDLVTKNGKGVLDNLTNKKKLTKQTTFKLSKIEGLGKNGNFTSAVFNKKLVKKKDGSYSSTDLTSSLTLTAAQLQKLKKYEALRKVIKNQMNGLLSGYATGGMADFTGPAWLDGTKKKPEAVLNADQTRFLKEDLFGNSSNSLMSIVSALQDSMNSTYTSSVDNSNSVVIENISLNFEAGTISNDYDARRAGDTVVKEILKIARKTGNNSVSRR